MKQFPFFRVVVGSALVASVAGAQTTTRVSVATNGGEGNGFSYSRAITGDGRYVVFESGATNLVGGDTNGAWDIFIRDRQNSTTERVSVATGGTQGNFDSGPGGVSISANGRYVAFGSYASNLVSGDTNGDSDIFVRDRFLGTTQRVSVATGGGQANHSSGPFGLSMSADGRYVAFSSFATNLVNGDTNGWHDVFVRDRQSGTTERVSVAIGGAQGNGGSDGLSVSISVDGRFVAFGSDSNNLVSGDTNGVSDIFVRDRQLGTTQRVSVSTGGTQANVKSEWVSIAADGRFVAFSSWASNLVSNDTNGYFDIFVRDRLSATTERMSVATSGMQGNHHSERPSISADGRYVTFSSVANTLVPGDTNGVPDIFVRDRQSGTIERVSVDSAGAQQWIGETGSSSISNDGRYVTFDSGAANLAPGDFNGFADVFVRDRATPSYDYGYVYLGNTTMPMANVQVSALGTSVPPVYTNSEGRYVIEGVTGSHRVRARIAYVEPATGQPVSVTNYPIGDTGTAYPLGASSPSRIPDTVFPWPVVLQSGLYGSTSTWSRMREYLETEPGYPTPDGQEKALLGLPASLCFPMPSGLSLAGDNNPAGYNNTGLSVTHHALNAQRLRDWIQSRILNGPSGVLSDYLSPSDLSRVRISLVAHSMGGLISRAYEKLLFSPPVARHVDLDGVHGGTNFPLALLTPGLTQGPLNGRFFLPSTHVPGWNAGFSFAVPQDDRWLLYSCLSDGIVNPNQSPWGLGLEMLGNSNDSPSGAVFNWLDGTDVPDLNNSHSGIHDDPAVLRETALFLANGERPLTALPVQGPLTGGNTPGLLGGTLSAIAGGLTQQAVSFDSTNQIQGSIIRIGADAQYQIVGTNGPTPLSEFVSQELGTNAWIDSFRIASPPTGPVTLTLTAGPTTGAELNFCFTFDNLRQLSVQVSPPTANATASVGVVASIIDAAGLTLIPTGPAIATAMVRMPDSTNWPSFQLFDDGLNGDGAAGDGVFGGLFGGPSQTAQEGRYGVACQVELQLGTNVVERTGSTDFVVVSTGATITGQPSMSTPDADGTGLFDALVFQQAVTFGRNGAFRAVATVRDSTGALIGDVDANYTNTLGATTQALSLIVPSDSIVRHGVNGPWVLHGLTLYDLDAGVLPCTTIPDFTTQAYSVQDFDPPPPPRIDWLQPTDGIATGGTQIVLNGEGLADVTAVYFGDRVASFEHRGEHTLAVTSPHYRRRGRTVQRDVSDPLTPPLRPWSVDVKIVTPWGIAVTSRGFTYR